MGNQLAPPFAIIFMHHLESKMLRSAVLRPSLYGRYIDDVLVIWIHGRKNLQSFVEHCNQQHPRIKFTHESTADGGTLPFLDVLFQVDAAGELAYSLYRKPSDSNINVDYHSAAPRSFKSAVGKQHFRRAFNNSSSEEQQRKSLTMTRALLHENNYPNDIIKELEVRSRQRTKRQGPYMKDNAAILRVPFRTEEIDRKVRKLVRGLSFPINIVNQHTSNLKNVLVRTPLQPSVCQVSREIARRETERQDGVRRRGRPMSKCVTCVSGMAGHLCDVANVVYSMKCILCSDEYIGETCQKVRERFQQHHFQARHKKILTHGAGIWQNDILMLIFPALIPYLRMREFWPLRNVIRAVYCGKRLKSATESPLSTSRLAGRCPLFSDNSSSSKINHLRPVSFSSLF